MTFLPPPILLRERASCLGVWAPASPEHVGMVATTSLSQLLTEAKAKGLEPARCGYDLCRAIVSGIREARANRPDLVMKLKRLAHAGLIHMEWR